MKVKIINWKVSPGFDFQGYYFNIPTIEEGKEIARNWIKVNKAGKYTVKIYDKDVVYFEFSNYIALTKLK